MPSWKRPPCPDLESPSMRRAVFEAIRILAKTRAAIQTERVSREPGDMDGEFFRERSIGQMEEAEFFAGLMESLLSRPRPRRELKTIQEVTDRILRQEREVSAMQERIQTRISL